MSAPNANASFEPARAASSHSASVGSRNVRPLFALNHLQNSTAPFTDTEIAGRVALPKPRSIRMYGLLGRVQASVASFSASFARSIANTNASYMSHVVSLVATRNGSTSTFVFAPLEGSTTSIAPPGTGTKSRLAVEPGIGCEKAFGAAATGCALGGACSRAAAPCAPISAESIAVWDPPLLAASFEAQLDAAMQAVKSARWSFLCAVIGLVVAACETVRERELERFEYSRHAMGGEARLVLYAASRDAAIDAAEAAFARIAAVEDALSDYRDDNELARLVARAGDGPIEVSRDLFDATDAALRFARASDGAFDPTIAPLVALWRASRRSRELPEASALADARALVGWRGVELDRERRTIALAREGTQLDFGAIGQGFACDRALEVLRAHGIASALVEISGDIAVSHAPPGARGWVVDFGGDVGDELTAALEQPDASNGMRAASRGSSGVPVPAAVGDAPARLDGTDSQVGRSSRPARRSRTLVLVDCGITTSGDAEQAIEIDGVRYAHLVDPATGVGLAHAVRATVVARDATSADALATALCVLGIERGFAMLERFEGASAFMEERRGGSLERRETPGFGARADAAAR